MKKNFEFTFCNPSLYIVVAVRSLSRVQLFVIPWTTALQASLSFTISWSLLRLMFIGSVMPSNHLILCAPSPPAPNLSQHQGLFQWVSSSYQVAKVLELQSQHRSHQWITLGLSRYRYLSICYYLPFVLLMNFQVCGCYCIEWIQIYSRVLLN